MFRSCLGPAVVALATALASADLPSPFVPDAKQPLEGVTRLSRAGDFDATVGAARAAGAGIIRGFHLDAATTVSLLFRVAQPLAPDAVIIDGATGRALPTPDVVMLAGEVVGEAGSSFFLAVSPFGDQGWVRIGDAQWIISTGPWDGANPPVIYRPERLPEGALTWDIRPCGGALPPPLPSSVEDVGQSPAPRSGPCGVVTLAVETDWEYNSRLFSGNVNAATAYVATVFGAVSEIFQRDFGVDTRVTFVRVWSQNNDPYPGNSTVNNRLTEFRNHWTSNMNHVSRHVAHMLTGLASGAGGIAYLSALCSNSIGYAVSGHLRGSFPYPLQNHHPQNWDLMVIAHELGHNFGAPHTHSMEPPADGCGNSDCSRAWGGTIMSYCHTCSGGMANIALVFHPRTISEAVIPYLGGLSSCGINIPPIFTRHPVGTVIEPGQSFLLQSQAAAGASYQWRRNGADIPGARLPNYGVFSATPGHTGTYVSVATNACGVRESAPAFVGVYCRADFNRDGDVDFFDYLDFVEAYDSERPSADFNRDGVVDFFDYLDFVLAYDGPCP